MRKRFWGGLVVALLAALCLMPAGAWADDAEGVQIDTNNFPDATFRSYVSENCDLDHDGYLSKEEIAKVTEIICGNEKITDLTGIEHFTALQLLDCSCSKLTSLDVSHNTALKELDCSDNSLTSLDVRANTALELFSCGYNQLTALDVSQNAALQQLDCGKNKLESIVVSSNTALTALSCQSNNISSLDLSANESLTYLNCSSNAIGSLNLGSCPNLKQLFCSGCSLKELDVSSQEALVYLKCSDNQLTELNVANNARLGTLDCEKNAIVSLDVSQNKALTYIVCGNNSISKLDVSNNTALQSLFCSTNALTSLDLSKNTSLKTLACNANRLTSLDVSGNTLLNYFKCNNNTCTIGVDDENQFDLSKLPGFSADKASGWNGGSVADGVLTVADGARSVTYKYDCGDRWSATFTLRVGYAVSFDTDGGSEVAEQAVEPGGKATKPESDPTWAHHIFDGWYADEACSQEYDFDSAVNASTTVYAKWIEDSEAPVVSGIEEGVTYCSAQKVTVTDEHLGSVTVNGVAVELGEDGSFTLAPTVGEQKVVATDRAGNTTTVTVTVNDGHTWNENWSHDANEHWHECSVCGEKKDVAKHFGGTADCVTPAICSACEEEYSGVDPNHHHGSLEHVAARAATTESEGNIEFWHCVACDKYYLDAAATKEISASEVVIPKLDPKRDEDDSDGGKKGESGGDKKKGKDNGKGSKKGSGCTLPATGDGTAAAILALAGALTALGAALITNRHGV